jgi:hypothetical protein
VINPSAEGFFGNTKEKRKEERERITLLNLDLPFTEIESLAG